MEEASAEIGISADPGDPGSRENRFSAIADLIKTDRVRFSKELNKLGFKETKTPTLVEATNIGYCKHLYQRGKLLGTQCHVAVSDKQYCCEHAKQTQHVLYKCTGNMFCDHKLVPCDKLTHNPLGRCRRHKINNLAKTNKIIN